MEDEEKDDEEWERCDHNQHTIFRFENNGYIFSSGDNKQFVGPPMALSWAKQTSYFV